MRGLVMVLMAIDHSSDAFNAGRLFTDSARMYHAGAALPVAQFLTRWITHICAPTFLFLAGTSLAFTVSRQVAAGDRPRDIDRYVLVRGLVIALFELWISFTVIGHGRLVLQVLYGIGTSYMLMVPLRRLPDRAAPILALAFIATSELLVRWADVGASRGCLAGVPPADRRFSRPGHRGVPDPALAGDPVARVVLGPPPRDGPVNA